MTSPPENHNLAIIPYEYPESPFILPDVLLIDSFGVTHLAYPLMVYTTHSDDDDTPLVKMIPKQLCFRLCRASRKYPPSAPSVAIPTKVTRAVQRNLDSALLTRSTKKSHGMKNRFIPPENPIDFLEDIVEPKKDKKIKRSASMGSLKKQDIVSKLVKKSSHTDDSADDVVVTTKTRKAWIMAFKKRKVIRGKVVTGIGGIEIGELLLLLQAQGWSALFLQGNRRRKMGMKETREFYINDVGSASFITSKVGGISFTLTAEVVVHSAAMDQLHISYGLEHAGLVEENSRLKDELAKTQAALETERSSNSAHLKNLVDLFAKGSPFSSPCVPPSV
ncbi:hypothetical protein R3W88_000901 [Solanum pinnatisectum]|uniref:Uncharacterized protein n=1 Tax=Solanum pinnatisectum TaxID=50273 RepID=A0AAV9MJF5_9SOLN|nr:hypothetical protein R3W88_000901 [Solanum pinnatisectum]